ncbi:ornithine decarboxylase-like isoform X2 [Amphiura filiformis]
MKCIPRVHPFYAMKCNHDNPLVKVLAQLGTGFECGSKREIQTVLDCGVKPCDIIYANTCKQESYVKFARQNGVSQMTFDNEDELYKINRVYSDSRLVLRLAPDDNSALTRVSFKYGCPPANAQHLLNVAKGLGLNVVGVSFHVGSVVQNPESYADPIRAARRVFDLATKLGFQMEILDIGGGFPGDLYAQIVPPFQKFADVINRELEQNFAASEFPSLRIISEPGRYFAGPGYTIVLNVIARHTIDYCDDEDDDKKAPEFRYYLNDGLYGSFLNTSYKPVTLIPAFLKERNPDEPKYSSSIWGQTCDGLDFITKSCTMNKLEVGEWVFVEALGAYSMSSCSNFNGFNTPACYYVAPKHLRALLEETFKPDELKT